MAHPAAPADPQYDIQAEIEDLKRSQLTLLLVLPPLIALLWLSYVISLPTRLAINAAPSFILWSATFVAYSLQAKHHHAACWLLLLGLVTADSLIIVAHPSSLALAFGTLTVMAAAALLGSVQAAIVGLLMWIASTVALQFSVGSQSLGWSNLSSLSLYGLTWVVSLLVTRPLKQSIQATLVGWTKAREALTEARARRGELYRALRALEEATYRIERMNNELLVARCEAEEARALKARFVATVSHELRNPLNLILGYSRLMALSPEKYGKPLPRAYRADVATIFRSSQHLLALVDDILDLSQIEAQRLPLVRDRVDLMEDVINKAISIVRPLAERKGLYVRQEVLDNLPWLLADPVRLRQVLLNLLTNAIRLTERGGITIRAGLGEGYILVSVADTGPGIAPEELDRLFQEFHRIRVTDTMEGAGTGLGLAICKHLVELHGGRIWVESQVGQGTMFSFTLPLPGMRAEAGTSETTTLEPREKPFESCLVVHDDPRIIRLLARYVEGYAIVGALDEQEAVKLTQELHPRAIITTPGLADSIYESLAHIACDVPIITCTMPRMIEQARATGVLGYLIKPIRPDALAALLRQVERDGGTTILLVDDDPDAVRLVERMLTALPHPYRILKAYVGTQALDLMHKTVPDIVLIDIVMPGLDGEQTVALMRADAHLQQVPVVFISARDWLQDTVDLQTPLTLRCRRPIQIARGTQCIQAMLDVISPDYLHEKVVTAPFPEE